MFDIFAASYTDYLARKKREGKKPLSRAEWEARTQGGTMAGPHPKGNKPPKTWKKKYSPKVESVMDQHALTDEDADQVREFKSDRPSSGVAQTPAQLMQRFLAKAKPETKERMKGVTPAEFMQMLGAIMDDEEGGQGKTATELRSRLIRLAHMRPELRSELLPLLKPEGKVAYEDPRPYGYPRSGPPLDPDKLKSEVQYILHAWQRALEQKLPLRAETPKFYVSSGGLGQDSGEATLRFEVLGLPSRIRGDAAQLLLEIKITEHGAHVRLDLVNVSAQIAMGLRNQDWITAEGTVPEVIRFAGPAAERFGRRIQPFLPK